MKKVFSISLVFLLLLSFMMPMTAQAESTSVEAPMNVIASVDSTQFLVEWDNPSSIAELEQSSYENYTGAVFYIIDWRVNKGAWHYDHEVPNEEYISDYYPDIHQQFWGRLSRANGMEMLTETRIDKIRVGIPYDMPIHDWLKNNSIEFRVRYIFRYWGTNLLHSVNRHSQFTNVYQLGTPNPSGNQEPVPTFGKYGIPDPPSSISAPQNLKADYSEMTAIYLIWTLPEEIRTLVDMEQDIPKVIVDWKLNDGEWSDNLEALKNREYSPFLRDAHFFIPYEDGTVDMGIEREDLGIPRAISLSSWLASRTYQFKVRYALSEYDIDSGTYTYIVSPYSNTVTIGLGTSTTADSGKNEQIAYKGASNWAVKELDKASQYGLITKRISGNMNYPITREELCEVIIKMYEKVKGEADWTTLTAFSDTKNSEIYKAYELGIVSGIGGGKFGPTHLTNREQVATMIYRTIKLIDPNINLNVEGAEKFSDEELISSWALESVKFMSKNDILKGSNGYVDPKGTTTREQAVLLVLRAYEKFAR